MNIIKIKKIWELFDILVQEREPIKYFNLLVFTFFLSLSPSSYLSNLPPRTLKIHFLIFKLNNSSY